MGSVTQLSARAYTIYEMLLKDHGIALTEDTLAHPTLCYIVDRAEDISCRRAHDEVQDIFPSACA
jgi:hypothetical protein